MPSRPAFVLTVPAPVSCLTAQSAALHPPSHPLRWCRPRRRRRLRLDAWASPVGTGETGFGLVGRELEGTSWLGSQPLGVDIGRKH
eukprot:scaffold40046_cov56-Phaeocystis_antarctica.AAC.2